MKEFGLLKGPTVKPTPVPVETPGGPGTADSHWRETVFRNEMMTALACLRQPVSRRDGCQSPGPGLRRGGRGLRSRTPCPTCWSWPRKATSAAPVASAALGIVLPNVPILLHHNDPPTKSSWCVWSECPVTNWKGISVGPPIGNLTSGTFWVLPTRDREITNMEGFLRPGGNRPPVRGRLGAGKARPYRPAPKSVHPRPPPSQPYYYGDLQPGTLPYWALRGRDKGRPPRRRRRSQLPRGQSAGPLRRDRVRSIEAAVGARLGATTGAGCVALGH